MVKSYLYDRRQQADLHGVISDWASILVEIPQGPLHFFFIYINGIVNGITSFLRLFADDASLYDIIDN